MKRRSGVIVYRADQGEYCKLVYYDCDVIGTAFGLVMIGCHVVNMRISDSPEEIREIDSKLEEILGRVNFNPISYEEREERINSAFC